LKKSGQKWLKVDKRDGLKHQVIRSIKMHLNTRCKKAYHSFAFM